MTGDWFWSRGGCVEGLQLTVLLRWSTHGCVHRECLLVLEARDIGVKWGRRSVCSIGSGSGRKGKPQQDFCYRAGDETTGVGSGDAEGEVKVQSAYPLCCTGQLLHSVVFNRAHASLVVMLCD